MKHTEIKEESPSDWWHSIKNNASLFKSLGFFFNLCLSYYCNLYLLHICESLIPSQKTGFLSAGHLSETASIDDITRRGIVLTTGDH